MSWLPFWPRLANSIWKRSIQGYAGKARYIPFFDEVLNRAHEGLGIGNSNIETNGELAVLDGFFEDNCSQPVIFDVGANIGDYAELLVKRFDRSEKIIHCFEPSVATFQNLKSRLKGYDVTVNNLGLSDAVGTMTLYLDEEQSSFGSLYKRELDHLGIVMSGEEKVELTTIDRYCLDNSIDRIDFLKLDVEGHELNVLNGAREMLKHDKIGYIQFEFGGCNIDSRTFFQDFWRLLADKYNIYRIVKDGVSVINGYSERLEVFGYQNFLAVHKSI